MDYIRSFFKLREKKSPQKRKPEEEVEKLSEKSKSNAEVKPADKEKQLKEKTNWTSFNYLRSLLGFQERKSAQKRKRDEKDEKLPNLSNSNGESKPVSKRKRLNEETNGFSLDTVQCRICLDVVSCSAMRSLPCAHVFHENCLFQWLEISIVCPLCKWPTIDNTDNALPFDIYELIETIENNEDVTGGNEFDTEVYEIAADGSNGDYPLDGSSSESESDGSSGKSPPNISRDKSPPNGSSGKSPPQRSNCISSPDGSNEESQPERSSGKPLSNGSNSESLLDGSSSESPPGELGSDSEPDGSSSKSLQDGSSGESRLETSRGKSLPDGLSIESSLNGSSGESPLGGSKGETSLDGSNSESPLVGSSGDCPSNVAFPLEESNGESMLDSDDTSLNESIDNAHLNESKEESLHE